MNPGSKPGAEIETKRVILLVLDTVRAASMSLYGGRARTPNLEAFGHDALFFENCIAPAPWTLPSHASMFTGLHPLEHECHGDLEEPPITIFNTPATRPLSDDALTLAEIFQRDGFATVGISSNPIVFSPLTNLGQGFQIQDAANGVGYIYQNSFRTPLHLVCALTGFWPQAVLSYRTADMITAQALSALEKAAEHPIFLFVNFMDAHEPYYPPRHFAGEFLNVRFPPLERFRLFLRRCFNRVDRKTWDSFQLTQYESEIMWLDSQLGLFFERLKQMGIYDDSLIIVTSDHGELLGAHDSYMHRTVMYNQVLRVPLIVKLPFGRRIGRVKARVKLTGIFPTIVSACSMPVPEYVSAMPLQTPGLRDQSVVASFFNFSFGRHLVLFKDHYKYLDFLQGRPNQLYDLSRDPHEQINQIDALQDVCVAMEAALDRELERKQALFARDQVDREVLKSYLKKLRALGYLQ